MGATPSPYRSLQATPVVYATQQSSHLTPSPMSRIQQSASYPPTSPNTAYATAGFTVPSMGGSTGGHVPPFPPSISVTPPGKNFVSGPGVAHFNNRPIISQPPLVSVGPSSGFVSPTPTSLPVVRGVVVPGAPAPAPADLPPSYEEAMSTKYGPASSPSGAGFPVNEMEPKGGGPPLREFANPPQPQPHSPLEVQPQAQSQPQLPTGAQTQPQSPQEGQAQSPVDAPFASAEGPVATPLSQQGAPPPPDDAAPNWLVVDLNWSKLICF